MKLGAKIGIVISIVVIIIGILTVLVLYKILQETFINQTSEKGTIVVQLISEEISNPLLNKDWLDVHQKLTNVIESNPTIQYAYVYDNNEGHLVHTFEKGFPKELIKLNKLEIKENLQFQTFLSENDEIKDIGYRIFDRLPYELHIGLSEKPLQILLKQTASSILLITIQGIFLGIILAMILSYFIIRPLRLLTDNVIDIENNGWSFSSPLKVYGNDEVSNLTKSIYRMTEKISKQMLEITNSKDKLEKHNFELSLLNKISKNIGGRVEIPKLLNSSMKYLIEVMNLSGVFIILYCESVELETEEINLENFKDKKNNVYFYGGCKSCKPVNLYELQSFSDINCILSKGEDIFEGKSEYYLSCCNKDHSEFKNLNIYPIINNNEILGFMQVCNNYKNLENTDHTTLGTIGRQLGVAIANRRLWEQLEESKLIKSSLLTKIIQAQEDERRRIARDLHDETSQSLTALSFGLKTLAVSLEVNDEKSDGLVDSLKNQVNHINHEIQKVIYDLRPTMLDDLGLIAAIRWLSETRLNKQGISYTININGQERRLPLEVEVNVYRIIQESISNASKYSTASLVTINIYFFDEQLMVSVSDNGIGFNMTSVLNSKNGLGILGMQERTELLNGDIVINSQFGKGTSIELVVPLNIL